MYLSRTESRLRIIVPIFLKGCLLDQDDYMSPCKVTEEAILNYEQSVIDESNNFDYKGMSKDFALLKFLLDKAWERGDDSVIWQLEQKQVISVHRLPLMYLLTA